MNNSKKLNIIKMICICLVFSINFIACNKNQDVDNVPIESIKTKMEIFLDNVEICNSVITKTDVENVDDFDVLKFGNYMNDDIEWIVIEKNDNEALLMTKFVIEAKKFNNKETVSWADSDLRKWLNEDFYNNSFTDEEKTFIINKQNHNENKKLSSIMFFRLPDVRDIDNINTTDKVSILSCAECEKYFGEPIKIFIDTYKINQNNKLATKATDYVTDNHDMQCIKKEFKDTHFYHNVNFWLRDRINYSGCSYVDPNGNIVEASADCTRETGVGVRPVILITLNNL